MLRHFLAALLVLTALSSAYAVPLTLKVNTSIKPPLSTVAEDGALDLVLAELFSRVGHELQLLRLPPARALVMVNRGESDVEVPRTAGMELTYTNLVMVSEPIIEYYFVGFTKGASLDQLFWDDLRGRSVAAIRGWKIYEEKVPTAAKTTWVSSPEQLFRMLDHAHAEVALHERYTGNGIIRQMGIQGVREASPPLALRPMYLYVHRRYASLAPRLAVALRTMKQDGTYARLMRSVLGDSFQCK
ncbi:substrate-binding periplasmic protein [Desulfovibrio ferrophilus]|uniref:Uncharacterized protein n=1 Tax=Desulfovibrio ferrophilus TaxID=241368 RepID=A0A2Z6B074_9BACT|nr:transporter substrate-binding domain-containing protein [Desulfovibrio ferrophilus]BBD08912.1 uncharacterized protein DFE_2186 [Desulfovibrio ferrophilus]